MPNTTRTTRPEQMVELKPCPFCGGEAKLKKGFPGQQKPDLHIAFVQCKRCKAKSVTSSQCAFEPWADVWGYAVERWNTRAAPAAPVVRAQWVGSRFSDLTGAYEQQCSSCQAWAREGDYPYCPNCGVPMEL